MTELLLPTRRPLIGVEKRLLRIQIESNRKWILSRGAAIAVLNLLLVGLVTLWKAGKPWGEIFIFASAIFVILADLSFVDVFKKPFLWIRQLNSTLRRNLAESYNVRATEYVQFEEVEHEGADYAFALDEGRTLFVSGHEFYPSARFPCLNFSVVHALDEQGGYLDVLIEKFSRKVPPQRIVPAATKKALSMPRNLEIRSITLDDLENALRRRQH